MNICQHQELDLFREEEKVKSIQITRLMVIKGTQSLEKHIDSSSIKILVPSLSTFGNKYI